MRSEQKTFNSNALHDILASIEISLFTTQDTVMATSLFIGEANLGSDPTLKSIPSAQPQGGSVSVLEFSARVNVDRKSKQTGLYEDTLGFWVDVSYWGKTAEAIAPLLKKGARVLLVGELGVEVWVSNQPATQGQARQTHKMKADHVAMLPWGIDQVIYRERSQAALQPQQAPQPVGETSGEGNHS